MNEDETTWTTAVAAVKTVTVMVMVMVLENDLNQWLRNETAMGIGDGRLMMGMGDGESNNGRY